MPEGAVYVGRPGRWGNPFRVGPAITCEGVSVPEMTPALAVQCYRQSMERALANWPSVRQEIATLRGKDVVCWCPVDRPCHADVLLEIANA